jgi:hypothetical protein
VYRYTDGRIQVLGTIRKVQANGTKRFVFKRPYQEKWFNAKQLAQAIIATGGKVFA